MFDIVYLTLRSALEEHEYRPEMSLSQSKPSVINSFLPIGDDGRREQIGMTVPPYIRESTVREERGSSATSVAGGYRGSSSGYTSREYNTPISFGSGTGVRRDTEGTMTPKDSVELLARYRDSVPERVETVKTEPQVEAPISATTTADAPPHKIIGEAFDCYVMVEIDDYMLVIDKHAAHERIIFENLKAEQRSDGRVQSQLLMLPIPVILSPDEAAMLAEIADDIKSVGFDFTLDSLRVDINATPVSISAEDAETLFVGMIDDAISGKGDPMTTDAIRRERALYQVACKAAIKGGRVYDRAVIEWLVSRVLAIPDITVCPHGRPIAYKLTKRELDKQFDRIK